MPNWSRKVAKAIQSPSVRRGIAEAIASYARRHIDTSTGRGDNGQQVALAPLKSLETQFWTTSKPKDGTWLAVRDTTVIRKRKDSTGGVKAVPVKVKEYLVTGKSYREGGQPLRDTGNLMRSLGARASVSGPSQLTITLRGLKYGIYHETGFETSGPNFIPLTKKGKRTHATGANPSTEGLQRGKDFFMAWGGVTVPKRPFLVPTEQEWVDIMKTIRLGLATVLHGRLR